MTSSHNDAPEPIPEEVIEVLDDWEDDQVREIIHYAQQLLQCPPPLTVAIEAREVEELVRIDDHGAYRSVIVERPGQAAKSRGPFAYRVQWEPEIDGDSGQYRWHYLGRVADNQESG